MSDEESVRPRARVWLDRFGLALAAAFFLVSTVMAIRNHGGMEAMFASDVKVLTFAHWQLEDGFREGFGKAIADYERLKAEQGVKVKVRQVAIPTRGYPQWFLTQLIGGDPADVLELIGNADLQNQYIAPLSPHIGVPNPWNRGTPLEGYAWRDTFVDDMLSAFDATYSEYFGVCIFMHTTRIFVNVDLYRAACGADAPMPATVTEWLAACEKIRAYAARENRPVIPIGVRGFDKSSLNALLSNYNSQMNADFAETSPAGYGLSTGHLYRQVADGTIPVEKLTRPVDLVAEIGQYFADGFPAIDLEQTKFLFSAGNVVFFIDGTWNAWSMVNNSPFPVEIIGIPVLDREHRLGRGAFGRISEIGSGITGRFGIAKKTRNFDLALDFLQYITSYDVNRMTMVEHCKWLSSLKHMDYEGLMTKFVPVSDTPYMPVASTFNLGAYTNRRQLQLAERAVIRNQPRPGLAFWDEFVADRDMIIDEQRESLTGIRRHLWTMDATRSALACGLAEPGKGGAELEVLRLRAGINIEGIVGRWKALDNQGMLIDQIPRLPRGEPSDGR